MTWQEDVNLDRINAGLDRMHADLRKGEKRMSFSLTWNDAKRIAYAAAFAFIGAFYPLVTGFGALKNFTEAKAAALALLPAAIAAALSAAKNGVLSDGSPLK